LSIAVDSVREVRIRSLISAIAAKQKSTLAFVLSHRTQLPHQLSRSQPVRVCCIY
jgi:hypothetical protein